MANVKSRSQWYIIGERYLKKNQDNEDKVMHV